MIRKVKSSPKMFKSEPLDLKNIVLKTMGRISEIVGATYGPGGKNVLIESDHAGIANKNTKDGVTVFNSLGSANSYEHLVIEQARDAAKRTATEAGDGPQPLYSKVLTPKGFVEMRDIKIGTQVCGTDGSIQTVQGVYPKGQKEIYEVEVENKGTVECCEDHLWTVSYGDTTSTKPLKDLIGDYTSQEKNGHNSYKYFVPTTYVEFNDNKSEMPLDPYLVGALLGDGSLRDSGSIELSLGFKKKHVIDKLKTPKGIDVSVQTVENKNYFRVKLKGTNEQGKSIRDIVRSIGLGNTSSSTKFIPKSYLYASKETREALLQGLLDTDGHTNIRGLFEFSTISKELANDFRDLVMSLGITVNTRLLQRSTEDGSYSNTSSYRITELKGYKNGNKIKKITKTGRFTEMQCIKVSNPDSLYITDNYVVTHNTTTSAILSAALIENLHAFTEKDRKYSPQKAAREMSKLVREVLAPEIEKKSIKITMDNQEMLRMVAKISANGDDDMADSVIKAFELIGYGDSSHVTIKEASGPYGYKSELIEGFPVPMGYEESIGKFHAAFINDQANQRCYLEKPLFLLFDGQLSDIITIRDVLENLGQAYASGESEFKNLVIFAHGYSENILNQLMWNFQNPLTINVVPMIVPRDQFINAELQMLMDISAFTGARIFGLKAPIGQAKMEDLGSGMTAFEIYRFRSTIVGDSDQVNVEVRADELKKQKQNCESTIEGRWLDERLGKLTNGIARLTIFGGSGGEVKERCDRVEDSVMAVRSSISKGILAGGCRTFIDLALKLGAEYSEDPIAQEILIPSLLTPIFRLLDNAGYSGEEASEIVSYLMENPTMVYDVENQVFGTAEELGVYDAAPAVEESLKNACSIATVLGTIGGIVAYPRDDNFERSEASADRDFERVVNSPEDYVNEANLRG